MTLEREIDIEVSRRGTPTLSMGLKRSIRVGGLHRPRRWRRRFDSKFRVGWQHLRAGRIGRLARCCRSREFSRLDFRTAPPVVNEQREDGRAYDGYNDRNPHGMPFAERSVLAHRHSSKISLRGQIALVRRSSSQFFCRGPPRHCAASNNDARGALSLRHDRHEKNRVWMGAAPVTPRRRALRVDHGAYWGDIRGET